ncbi:MAG: hypothetical protein HDR95_00810 [Bacteroides sp.]|nr:hypothetical protein [Bacteroides sp.]
MKKLFTASLLAVAALASQADDMIIYNNGQLNGELKVYGWWNDTADFNATNPTDANSKVFSFKATDGGAAASMGLFDDSKTQPSGRLYNSTLHFNWYATTPAKYTVQLTGGVNENYSWEVTEADVNQWHNVALSVPEVFPGVSAGWKDYASSGADYVFAIILENGQAESVIYFDNIYYSNIDTTWEAPVVPAPTTVPAIAQAKEDVISVFSAYGNNNFTIGNWNQSTQAQIESIDGHDVEFITNLNYLGWELNPRLDVSEYTHMHVDYWPIKGEAFGFTPISPGKENGWRAPELKLEEWNSYDVALTEFPCDWTDIFQIKFDAFGTTPGSGYIANVYFYKNGNETPEPPIVVTPGATFTGSVSNEFVQTLEGVSKEYPYTVNYTITYNEDKTLTIAASYVFTDGEPVGIVPGSVFVNNQINDFIIDEGKRVATTTATYEAGETVPVNFYIPVAAGLLSDTVNYTVGTANDDTEVSLVAAGEEAPAFYTLQGVRVANPEKGLFIRIQNGKATKVIL